MSKRSGTSDDISQRHSPKMGKQVYAAEQDTAANGRRNRLVPLSDGQALATVILRRKASNPRNYAYLRWSDHGKAIERYIGVVDKPNRKANLAEAWLLVTRRHLIASPQSPEAEPAHGELDHMPGRASWATSPAVRTVMQANKGRDTRPELAVRSAAHALGLRYRVGIRPEPTIRRTADIVFPRAKVAVFIDGCFWHGCPQHHRPAKRNTEFWRTKIADNIARDHDTDSKLEAHGWRVLRIWEHEEPVAAAEKIRSIVATPSQILSDKNLPR